MSNIHLYVYEVILFPDGHRRSTDCLQSGFPQHGGATHHTKARIDFILNACQEAEAY